MNGYKKALNDLVDAWESLKGEQNYTPTEIEWWLINDMKPAIDNARKLLKRD